MESYIALVEGKYYTTDGKDRVTYKPYSLKFRLRSAEKPLSDIVRYLLLDSLKTRYPDAEGYLTHHLIYIYNEQDPQQISDIPIQFMGYDQLKTFCSLRRLTYVELSSSIALDVLRTEVEIAAKNGQTDYDKVTELRKKMTKEANEVISGCELLPQDDHPSTQKSTSKPKTQSTAPMVSLVDDNPETVQPKPKPKCVRKPQPRPNLEPRPKPTPVQTTFEL